VSPRSTTAIRASDAVGPVTAPMPSPGEQLGRDWCVTLSHQIAPVQHESCHLGAEAGA
jgi:hypothetical protein